jgi:hypothetical protein
VHPYPDTPLGRAVEGVGLPVIVSLACHDMALAEAAREAGAAALKLHLNAYHRASGTTFGGLNQERGFFRETATLGLPLLVMAGQEEVPTPEEMDELAELGVEGFNVYLDHLKPHLLASRLRPMPALSSESTGADLDRARAIPGAWIEASVTPFAAYGQPLDAGDLGRYRSIAAAAGVPVIAPSQKHFAPADVALLQDAGIAALLLGVIVTGTTPTSLYEGVRPFVEASHAAAVRAPL